MAPETLKRRNGPWRKTPTRPPPSAPRNSPRATCVNSTPESPIAGMFLDFKVGQIFHFGAPQGTVMYPLPDSKLKI